MGTKITKGKWRFEKTRNMVIEVKSDGVVMVCEIDLLNMPNYPTPVGAEANAKLIVDAGNTANKCGLLPSELLEQRNELLEACKTLIQQAEVCNYHTSDRMHALLDNLAIKEVRTAIKKATEK